MMTPTYKNWKVIRDAQGICWLHLDKADTATNVLSAELLNELGTIIEEVKQDLPEGLVFLSDKANGFVAGADVNEFTGFREEKDALSTIKRVHEIFTQIENLDCPTVALIHGFCLGGGMELALTCRYIVADSEGRTRLGLPEVKLGIHPGFGGTYRSIQRVGVLTAMDMMLTGRTLSARAAKKIGLIDYAIPQRHFANAALSIINKPPARKSLSWWKRLISHKQIRPWLARLFVQKISARVSRTHYPAPFALIDLWVQYYDDAKVMLRHEAQSVAKLITGRTAQNLIRVFQLQNILKTLGKQTDYQPVHIHVIGGGVMGGDIAAWCAYRGMRVTIQDRNVEALGGVTKRAYTLYKKRLKTKRLVTEAMDRLIPDPKGHGLKRADIIIEAIFEDVKVKQQLFKSIENTVKPDAILATNTSSIPLDEISTVLKDKSRLVGLHFFNPVASMPLLEIVQSPNTDKDIISKASQFAREIDKLPLPVTSTPGFLVNRILMPYMMEAMLLAEENVPLPIIDKAATDFGMPMGPIELADTVGLDICLHVATNLSAHMNIEVPERLQNMVNSGKLGKKSGAGFYVFNKGKPVKGKSPKDYVSPVDIQDRLILRMLNEAVACLREQVVTDIDLADAGIIFGTGFAPFRGGPCHYIQFRGAAQLLKMLEHLQQRYGPRFAADEGWQLFEQEN